MKDILLAGGRGTRISRYVGEKPKCTLDIGGMSLIRHTVEMLLRNHVDVSIAVGYNKEMVVNSLEGLNVRYFYNPFYDVTKVCFWLKARTVVMISSLQTLTCFGSRNLDANCTTLNRSS